MCDSSCIDRPKSIAIDGSLHLIKDAQTRLRDMGDTAASPEAIASRIHLYDVLLCEIRGIRTRLKRVLHVRRPSSGFGRKAGHAMH
jgi:hypothetical protein